MVLTVVRYGGRKVRIASLCFYLIKVSCHLLAPEKVGIRGALYMVAGRAVDLAHIQVCACLRQHMLFVCFVACVVQATVELLKSAVSHTLILIIIVVAFGGNSFFRTRPSVGRGVVGTINE